MTTLELRNYFYQIIQQSEKSSQNWKMYLQIIKKKDEQLPNRHFIAEETQMTKKTLKHAQIHITSQRNANQNHIPNEQKFKSDNIRCCRL